MELGLFCFRGSGCAFLIYPAQARIIQRNVLRIQNEPDALTRHFLYNVPGMKIVIRIIGLLFGLLLTAATNGAGVDSVRVSGAEEDAFRLSWDAVDGADWYVVNVWTNGVADASEGAEVLCERFSNVPSNDYNHLWSMNDINGMGDYGYWVGEGMHGYERKSADDLESAIVLGSTTASGWLRSEPLELSKETIVRLRLTRHTKDDTASVLVAFLKNGETNFAENVRFGTAVHSFSDYTVIASNLTSGCQLLIASQKTGARISDAWRFPRSRL